jgi:hypothetical protein
MSGTVAEAAVWRMFFPAVAADAVARRLAASGYEAAVSADFAEDDGSAVYVQGGEADLLRGGDGSAASVNVRVLYYSTRDTARLSAVAYMCGLLGALDPAAVRAAVEEHFAETLPGWRCTRVAWAKQGEDMAEGARVYYLDLSLVIAYGERV